MLPLLSREASRAADTYTIETLKFPEILLMEHAAIAIVRALKDRFGSALKSTHGLILAGTGNNGADAVACSRILAEQGMLHLKVLLLGDRKRFSKALLQQLAWAKSKGVSVEPWRATQLIEQKPNWIVDGLYGTGLSRPVQGTATKAIQQLNAITNAWVVAVDLPSGLCANTGMPLGIAVKASETITLGFIKRGLVTGEAANFVGRLSLATIQIPRRIAGVRPSEFLIEATDLKLPQRLPTSHKGSFGHVHVWAGAPETQGAPMLSAWAALRAGSGLVSLVGTPEALEAIRPRLPVELMTEAVRADLFKKKAGAVGVLGPGLGRSEEAWGALRAALLSEWVLVLDADALNLVAAYESQALRLLRQRKPGSTVLTPHPKEASRLLSTDLKAIQSDRFESCRKIVQKFHAACLLKGRGTLLCSDPKTVHVVTSGDTGLAKGGSGDVLSGILASFLGQGCSLDQALGLAVWIHGRVSEWLTERRGTARCHVAGELNEALPEVLKEWECGTL